MFSKIAIATILAISGVNGFWTRPDTYDTRTSVNRNARNAVGTVRDPNSSQTDRF